ncbi:hypothetical protein ACHAPA_011420 [Fusarium lateritium]
MDLSFNSASDAAKSDLDDDKKRKHSNSPITATKAHRLTIEPSLTPIKMPHQLRNDVRLTDDVLNVLCQSVKVTYNMKTAQIKYPLWFYDDQHSPDVPSAL